MRRREVEGEVLQLRLAESNFQRSIQALLEKPTCPPRRFERGEIQAEGEDAQLRHPPEPENQEQEDEQLRNPPEPEIQEREDARPENPPELENQEREDDLPRNAQ
ncbi:hypothetical protein OSTOST_04059 [Ostertagia ostertagi]